MAKIRNVSDGTLDLRVDGFTATVEQDEVTEVPDVIFAAYVWPESLWAVVVPAKSPKASASTEEK